MARFFLIYAIVSIKQTAIRTVSLFRTVSLSRFLQFYRCQLIDAISHLVLPTDYPFQVSSCRQLAREANGFAFSCLKHYFCPYHKISYYTRMCGAQVKPHQNCRGLAYPLQLIVVSFPSTLKVLPSALRWTRRLPHAVTCQQTVASSLFIGDSNIVNLSLSLINTHISWDPFLPPAFSPSVFHFVQAQCQQVVR